MAGVRRRTAMAVAVVAVFGSCGGHTSAAARARDQRFLNSVYSQAPDISNYRSSTQLVSLGQAICQDLEAGASILTVGDRVPLIEGSVALPPAELGVVISSSVAVFCPRFKHLLPN
jgi:hypothetical protein